MTCYDGATINKRVRSYQVLRSPITFSFLCDLSASRNSNVKAGFKMIADDRRRSQRELFPYNRRRSQTIAEPAAAIHFGQQKCQMYTRVVLAANLSKQHGGHRGGNFAASKFTSSFSPEATASSASKAKETSVLSSKNIHEQTKTWGIPHTAERTSCF